MLQEECDNYTRGTKMKIIRMVEEAGRCLQSIPLEKNLASEDTLSPFSVAFVVV